MVIKFPQLGRALPAVISVACFMSLFFLSCGNLVTPTGFDSFAAPQGYDASGFSKFLNAAAVCMESDRDDKQANLDRIGEIVGSVMAAHPDTDVIVFPELCTGWLYVESDPSGYFSSIAEPIPGPSTDRVKAIAAAYGVSIVFGLAEVNDDLYYNSQALVKPDGDVDVYRKRGLNGGDLANGCSPADGMVISDIKGIPVTFAICSDYQDEKVIRDISTCAAPAVLASLATATVLNPSIDFFARSLGKWVVYANGGGLNSGMTLPGGVFIADPTGTVHDPAAGPVAWSWFSIGVE